MLIDLRDTDFDLDSCHKTFSRPSRVLRLLMVIEKHVQSPDSFQAFNQVVQVYGEDRRHEVLALWKRLFEYARSAVVLNSGRYLSGVYLFAGLADPDFAPTVFDVFAVWKKKLGAPRQLGPEGTRLLQFLRDSVKSGPDEWLDQLLDDVSWKQVCALLKTLHSDRASFVSMIKGASDDNYVLFTLRSWLAALSHTRPVEKTLDNQSKGLGGSKTKASEATGKVTSTVTRESKVLVANQLGGLQKQLLLKLKPSKKKIRLEAKDDTIAAVGLEFDALTFTEEVLIS